MFVYSYVYIFIVRNLEAKLPTIWTDGKSTATKKLKHGESQRGEDKGEKIRDGES